MCAFNLIKIAVWQMFLEGEKGGGDPQTPGDIRYIRLCQLI
jgi:hypothetical protein